MEIIDAFFNLTNLLDDSEDMMALVDSEASKELILSVRDEIRLNLFGHGYNDRDEFFSRYKNKKYDWLDKASKKDK